MLSECGLAVRLLGISHSDFENVLSNKEVIEQLKI